MRGISNVRYHLLQTNRRTNIRTKPTNTVEEPVRDYKKAGLFPLEDMRIISFSSIVHISFVFLLVK